MKRNRYTEEQIAFGSTSRTTPAVVKLTPNVQLHLLNHLDAQQFESFLDGSGGQVAE